MQKPKFKIGDKVRRVFECDSTLWRHQANVACNQELTVAYCSPYYINFVNAIGTWEPAYFEPVPKPMFDPEYTDRAIAAFSDTTSSKPSPSDYLHQAADTLDERGKQYDASGTERSMDKTVAIFNILTGNNLSTAEGWQFMKVLKDVRLWSNTDEVHSDSIIDNLGYTALLAEETISLGGKLKANRKES